MRVIDHRHFKRVHGNQRRWPRYLLIGTGVVLGVFVLANLIMGFMYRNKVLPNYYLGAVSVGDIPFDQLDNKVSLKKVLPEHVSLTKDDKKQEPSPLELGVTVDWQASRENLKRARSWLPMASLFGNRTVPVELKVNTEQFNAAIANLNPHFAKEALPERVVFNGTAFAIAASEDGYQLDGEQLKSQLLAMLEDGEHSLTVPTQSTTSDNPTGQLTGELTKLQKQLATKLTYVVDGQAKQPTAGDIGKWFVPEGQTMALSEDKIKEYIVSLSSAAYNTTDAAAAARYVLSQAREQTFVLGTTQTPKKYTYCTAVKGVSTAELPGLRAKVAATLGEPRGWNAGGKIAFNRVDSNCDFTVWLSAPSFMTSFGGVCDSYYSCRSGRNVVINFDRWQGATDPWNAAGGSLEDYRVMVTNHETGHWLGFGHAFCPGAGQPAPVMQQQSISLQGCTFNPWPTASELAAAKSARGL
jgi:hypothetical protein